MDGTALAATPTSISMFPNRSKEDDRLCATIGPGVWLMDDHRWAFYVWAQHALRHPERLPLCLVHIDAHADAVDGFLPDPASWAELQRETDLARIYERVAQDSDITLAAFIAPAVRRGWITEVHFFGCDDDDLLDAPLLAAAGASQWRHERIGDLVQAVEGRRLLLDVDIDVFNDAEARGQSRLWPEEEIIACVEAWTPLIQHADVITIARSFGFSGTASDTVRLTELVVPRVLHRRATT
jgi:hypothetical protein